MSLRRTLLAALAATALIAPAAHAQPADMHASTAQAAAKAQQHKQDLRSPDARDASVTLHRNTHAVNAPGATAAGSASEQPPAVPAGQPTWPVNPKPIAAPVQQPVDNGSPLPMIPLVAGLLGVVLAATAARYGVRRSQRRTRVAL